MNRTTRALVSLYALLCLLAGVFVPALHAADVGAFGQTAAEASQQDDRRDDTPAPQPHDHQGCVICHAGHGTPALPEQSSLELRVRLIEILDAPRTSPVRASAPSVSLPPSRAPPRA
ncbi:MAG TPA: DUF2946 family protein [Longimicrobium sp.]|nr:DUF2946 family protein [Longimicrobium sp.]